MTYPSLVWKPAKHAKQSDGLSRRWNSYTVRGDPQSLCLAGRPKVQGCHHPSTSLYGGPPHTEKQDHSGHDFCRLLQKLSHASDLSLAHELEATEYFARRFMTGVVQSCLNPRWCNRYGSPLLLSIVHLFQLSSQLWEYHEVGYVHVASWRGLHAPLGGNIPSVSSLGWWKPKRGYSHIRKDLLQLFLLQE